MIIESANINDAQEILQLQKLAYQSEAKIYDGFQIPPLLETLEELKTKFKTHLILKATVNGKIVGSVRAYEKDGACHVGRLMVHPSFQNRGIGGKLLLEIEHQFPTCVRFELFTGNKSQRNLHLYEKLGYKPLRNQQAAGNINLVYLQKIR